MDKLQLLQSVFGQCDKANQEYYQFYCPFCQHHKKKLGINLNTGYVKCWVCGPKGGVVNVLHKLRYDNATISKFKTAFNYKSSKKIVSYSTISLPNEFKRFDNTFFGKRAYEYVKSRGITDKDIIKYGIGYCDSGKYSGRIIIPDYNEHGELIYFTARSYEPFAKLSTLTPQGSKNVIFDELLINWSEPIILVEGKFDAIVVRRNAIPLYGKIINDSIKNKIIENNVKEIYICLDGDAYHDIMQNCTWFVDHGITTYRVILPENEDPASLGHDLIWKYINQSKVTSTSDVWLYNMKNKLK